MSDDCNLVDSAPDLLPVYTAEHWSLVATMAELGGVARYADLAYLGQREVTDACRDGVIVRNGRGQYIDPGLGDHRRGALLLNGTLSHLSAAVQHGWSLKKMPDRPHVTVRPNRHIRASVCKSLRVYYRAMSDEEIIDGVTEPLRTVLDCARDLAFDEALTVADSALRVGAVGLDELRARSGSLNGRGSVRARAVLAAADGRAANPLESVLRALCLQIDGLLVEPQVAFENATHRAVADLADIGLGIVVEGEGFETHGSRVGFDKDCRRYTELVCAGKLVVRCTYTQVMYEPDWVRARLAEVLALARTRAPEAVGRSTAQSGGESPRRP